MSVLPVTSSLNTWFNCLLNNYARFMLTYVYLELLHYYKYIVKSTPWYLCYLYTDSIICSIMNNFSGLFCQINLSLISNIHVYYLHTWDHSVSISIMWSNTPLRIHIAIIPLIYINNFPSSLAMHSNTIMVIHQMMFYFCWYITCVAIDGIFNTFPQFLSCLLDAQLSPL